MPREFFFLFFLFQPQNGLSSPGSITATEKLEETDVAEALDLSEKLVGTPSIRPLLSEPACPADSLNINLTYIFSCYSSSTRPIYYPSMG